MPNLPPSWAFKVYSKLWLKLGDKPFSNESAQKIINSPTLNQALSRLKRDGCLIIARSPKDSRRSVYYLKNPELFIKEVVERYAASN